MASAILTAIDASRFTIIDVRALEALGVKKVSPTVEFYLEYLVNCRLLAVECGVDLRTLDRAMWQWSGEQADSIKARIDGSTTERVDSERTRAPKGSVKVQILHLARQGMPVAEISRTLGKHYSHVYTTVHKAGLR